LRANAPERRPRLIGRVPLLETAEQRDEVVTDALASIYAPTTLASNDARWRTISRILAKFGLEVFPPSVEKVVALGAALRAGSFRSAPGYLSLYRVTSVRQGFGLDGSTEQALRDMKRACSRGLGAPIRARALPLDLLSGLPGDVEPWAVGGAISPRNFLVVWGILDAPRNRSQQRQSITDGAYAGRGGKATSPSPHAGVEK